MTLVQRPGLAVDDRPTLLREVAIALHRAGAPAHRLESTVNALAAQVGVEVRLSSTPTGITLSFGPVEDGHTTLVRAEPGALDLGRLAEVDRLTSQLLGGELTLQAAVVLLRRQLNAPVRFGFAWSLLGFSVSAAAATVVMGGATGDVLAAAVVGAVAAVWLAVVGRARRLDNLRDLLSAFGVALVAGAWSTFIWPLDQGLVTVAALIVLVPGLTLTTAITELATRHLVSGTARLASAGVTFASLGLGAVAGATVMAQVANLDITPLLGWVHTFGTAPPPWLDWVAVGVAAVAFTVLMQARWRDLPWIALTCFAGFGAVSAVGPYVSPPLDAAVGALAVALVSNTVARALDRPAAVPLVPGLFMLVPGSMGFRSLVQLLDSGAHTGVDDAVAAVLTAVALAVGVLMAQALIPPRRAL